MKVVLQDQFRYILRVDAGEEVFAQLKNFAEAHQISSAYFSGIGACSQAQLSYFNLHSRQYQTHLFGEDMEIVALTGNVSLLNGEVALHAHAVLAKADFTCLGGHVMSLTISATCEIFLVKLAEPMHRTFQTALNLNLLS